MNVVSSDVEICNMALDYLNVLNITSLDEGTKQAKKCKALYDIVRKKLLTNLNASFSIERTILTEDANYKIKYLDSNKVNYYGYKNAFVIPNDCLQIICVGEPLNNELYQIEGRYLLCNREKTCPVTYIKDVDNVALYDPSAAQGPEGTGEIPQFHRERHQGHHSRRNLRSGCRGQGEHPAHRGR